MRDVKAANGYIVARVDSSGRVTLGPDPGPIAGLVNSAGEIFDDDAGVRMLGRVSGEGIISNTAFEVVGKVDTWGRVYDRFGVLAGSVEKASDAGVLMLLASPTPTEQSAPATPSENKESALMDEALDLAQEYSAPKVRKNFKPLTDRDLFMERMPRKPEQS